MKQVFYNLKVHIASYNNVFSDTFQKWRAKHAKTIHVNMGTIINIV